MSLDVRKRCAHPLVFLSVLTVAACGGDSGQPEAPMTETEAPAEMTEAAPAAEPAEAVELEVVEESAGDAETGESAATEEAAIVLAESAPEATTPARTDWKYSAGRHFVKFTSAQGTSSPPDKIEVVEVFWYGCPHCFNFEPYINKWKQDLPDDVSFVRVPVMWNPTNQIHARMFYTAEALGKLDEMHEPMFREFHINRNTLVSEDAIRAFFVKNGISEADFDSTFRSFAVESKLKRARNLTERYQITSVPILVTNGKYLAKGDAVKTFEDMLAVTDELVERERQPL